MTNARLFAAVLLLPAWVIKRPEPTPRGGRPRETVVAFPAPDDGVDAEEPASLLKPD